MYRNAEIIFIFALNLFQPPNKAFRSAYML